MRILVCDDIAAVGVKLFLDAGFEVHEKGSLKAPQLAEIIGEYDGLVVRSATKVSAETLDRAQRLRVIGRAGTGVDNIDAKAATRHGVVVMNAAQGNTITTAEHTIALLMSLARLTPQAAASLREGKWEKSKFLGTEINNKTLGIIGVGKIGAVVASRAQGLGMRIVAYDPYLSVESAARLGITLVSLDDLYARADFITIHTPMTAETKGLVNAAAFELMKDGVRMINCARGGLISEADLLKALDSGKVAGAALDVFEQEPPDPNNPLLKHDRVVCTPHLGASTEEAQIGVAVTVAEQMVDFLKNGTVRGAVNVPSLTIEQLHVLQPYLSLAETIGSFLGQAFGSDISEVAIEYGGEVAKFDTGALTQAALVGLFGPANERLNFVNATVMLEERGIKLTETKDHHARDFLSLLTLWARGPEGEHEVSGALFDGKSARIVRVNGCSLEAFPRGNMIVLLNQDVPGVVGRMATFLGEQRINIGRFHLGRKEVGGTAVAIIEVDTPLAPVQLAELEAQPNIELARQVHLD